jgi:hypothetical protein
VPLAAIRSVGIGVIGRSLAGLNLKGGLRPGHGEARRGVRAWRIGVA